MSSQRELLQKVATGQISIDEAESVLKNVSDERQVHVKVTPKGAIGFYGLRRMPIVLYQQELEKILNHCNSEDFKQFLSKNDAQLSKK